MGLLSLEQLGLNKGATGFEQRSPDTAEREQGLESQKPSLSSGPAPLKA